MTARRVARLAAARLLYAAALQGTSAAAALLMLRKSDFEEKETLDDELTQALVTAADERDDDIAALITEGLSRPSAQLSNMEWAIIRSATAELLIFPLTSHRVIIDEAVEIAKQFGAEGGYKIVNGALNAIAAKVRGDGNAEGDNA